MILWQKLYTHVGLGAGEYVEQFTSINWIGEASRHGRLRGASGGIEVRRGTEAGNCPIRKLSGRRHRHFFPSSPEQALTEDEL